MSPAVHDEVMRFSARFPAMSLPGVFEEDLYRGRSQILGIDAIDSMLEELRGQGSDRVTLHTLGESEKGRPIRAAILGDGPERVSLLGGAHSDEPIGPMTLALLVDRAARAAEPPPWMRGRRLVIVPHVNPDGAVENAAWIEKWPDLEACVRHVMREPPGRDVEFGYPDMRPENRAVAGFLSDHGPFRLHMSLHGMLFSEGGLLLIEREWIDRTADLRERYAAALRDAGLRLFDHDRKGEKGFEYIGAGFTTTPRGEAMRAHFESLGDTETASKFHLSSMEFVRSLGGDPLSLVTEIPLFVLTRQVAPAQAGVPTTYLAFKEQVPQARVRLERGESIDDVVERFGIEPLEVSRAIALQLAALELGLQAISD